MPQVEVEPVTEFITNDLYNWATEANMVEWVIGSDRQVAWQSTPVVICYVIGE